MKGESELGKQGGRRIFVKQVDISQNTDQVKKHGGKDKQEKREGMSGWVKKGCDSNKGRLCGYDITFFAPKGT